MADLIVDAVAEYIQEIHIANNVCQTAVQKGISDKLPQIRPAWMKHKSLGPDPKWLLNDVWAYPDLMGPVAYQEDNYIDYNECIICIWCPVGPYARSNW